MPLPPLVNVAQHLPAMAEREPDRLAVVDPGGRGHTFASLDRASDQIARRLYGFGVRRGMRTVVMVPPSLEFFEITFALFKLGAVLVLIDPGMGVRNLGRCLGEAEPEAFVGIRRAQVARKLLGWARPTVRVTVGVGTRLLCQYSLEGYSAEPASQRPATEDKSWPPAYDVASDEMAAILFTSGSTGVAKGAVYTHGTFATQVEALRRLFDIRPGEIDLCTFPLFALFAPALGMTAIIPEMSPTRPAGVHPPNIIGPVHEWGVTNLFGSPALLNVVGRYAVSPRPEGAPEGSASSGRGGTNTVLPSLRRVISAGAPVPATVIERMTQMLRPGVQVYTPYGATEVLPVACIGSDEILKETRHRTDQGAGVCVGRPVPEVEVAIIPVSDEAIAVWDESLRRPANEIGEIAVRGPYVTREYFNRPEATRLAKIPVGSRQWAVGSENRSYSLPTAHCPLPTGCPLPAVWHRMGDVGYLDESGRLWFCGRKAHRVRTANGTLYTIPVEAVFNTHPAVFRTALVGVGAPDRQTPVL
ncbi:MAG TPA: fatty acid CoA ligase family protein [Gemmataceae bacterium]|nr:fatty acid CoA ligase family protein [Gemmataceae bacterium]